MLDVYSYLMNPRAFDVTKAAAQSEDLRRAGKENPGDQSVNILGRMVDTNM
jgi:hypothetical protein